jgi:hypothetical protein
VSATHALSACVDGIGLLGPGLPDWPRGRTVLGGAAAWVPARTELPLPQLLPPAERRRSSVIVRATLAAGLEACAAAGADPAALPAVFSSSGGDGENCHEICETLATDMRQVSPTRFHNSVHNAAAGYWSIATRATQASSALCAYDASFAAGLLEALTLVVVDQTPVLLIAYDAPYREPLRSHRPVPDAFAVALILAPAASAASLTRLTASLCGEPPEPMADAALEGLRAAIPAARALPLLALLARGATGRTRLDYLNGRSLAVELAPCR